MLATFLVFAGASARAQYGIEPIPDQTIPSGKTLVVPIVATDPGGPARSYSVTVSAPTVTTGSTTTPAIEAGINAIIRTGDPHFYVGVSYTDSNSMQQTGTMEFQMLREYSPIATQIINGLTQGGFYSPKTSGTATNYIIFHRVLTGFAIQGGDPNGNGSGGPGFTFPNEFSTGLIFSATAGQLAMANSGNGVVQGENGTNGSQFFVTLGQDRLDGLDYGYTIFGQLLRGYDTLFGIAGTAVQPNSSGEDSSPINPVDITSATVAPNNTDAVILLSATGVCDATVTVTASSTSGNTVQTFVAHAVADTITDPPFLQPIPYRTAPNGNLKETLQGVDLQRDLLAYGYRRLLPVFDFSIATGTSPISPTVTIPLISNTDNTIAGAVDYFGNPSGLFYIDSNSGDAEYAAGGFNERVFHVGAGAKPIRGSLAVFPPGTGGMLTAPNPVAVFTAGNPKDTASSFTVSVNYGDSTYLSISGTTITTGTTGISIEKDSSSKTLNRYKILAPHTYMAPGEYPVIVKIADGGGAHLLLTGTANVSSSLIGIAGREIYNTGGKLKNVKLATFEDEGPPVAPAYTATIDWGDGTVSGGTVKKAGKAYQVLGTHTYSRPDTYTVSANVVNTTGTNDTAMEWSGVHVAGVVAPQFYPPFPQANLGQLWSSVVGGTSYFVENHTGANPYAGLVMGTDGNFYGTTFTGGINNLDTGDTGSGTVFEVGTSGSLSTVYSFTGGNDGANPRAGLLLASDSNDYGVTGTGGADGFGTVYQIGSTGSLSTIYSFTGGSDGGNPYGVLVQGTNGNLYGTAEAGGANGDGTVFELTTSGSLTPLYAFLGGADGANPYAGLVTGTDGNFYGTTYSGGTDGFGTVFQVTQSGSYTSIASLDGTTDGANPMGALLAGTDGALYGTASADGAASAGTVFQLIGSGTSWTISPLYTFGGGSDGSTPYAGLYTGSDGNLYGTTEAGGAQGVGTIFNISTSGSYQSLYSFTGGSDGGNPYAPLIQGTDGNFYGTTETDGTGGSGTVFQYVATSAAGGTVNTLYSFNNNSFQYAASCSVLVINNGDIPSLPGSLSVYIDPYGQLDGYQTEFTSNGQSSFQIPALNPGQSKLFKFAQYGTASNNQLVLPPGIDPTGQEMFGVVTYDDPVANYDGAVKIVIFNSF
ncbi:MAG TPA: choice-of-anchor tandem repeat GloVer-containing protein [Chthoniobacteraceae bacterium]|nr:choice-of-anchor tandem repeat GloVer-containing protein [Chthoniobacteraceae bacterium]